MMCAVNFFGCSAALNFNECNLDSDCAGRAVDGGPALFCTTDHFCVNGLPEDRLCQQPIGAFPEQHPVVIAGLFRLSGDSDSKDTAMANAAVLAIGEINQLMQRPISLVMCDTAGDSSNGQRAFLRAVDTFGAVAIVGPTTSGDALGIAQLATQRGILVVSPSATSPDITNLNDNGLIWRTCASDTLQSKELAKQAALLAPMGSTPPPVLDMAYVDSAYGKGLEQSFIVASPQLEPVQAVEFETGSDPTVVVSKLAMDTPTVSVLIADEDAARLVAALPTTGPLGSTHFLMTDGAKGLNLFGNPPVAGQVLARIRGTGPAAPSGPIFTAFQTSYEDQFHEDPAATSFVANTYDAFYAVALVVSGAPPGVPPTAMQLVNLMGRLSTAGVDVNVGPVDFVKGASTLQNGGSINLHGTSGELDWDAATGDVLSAPIEVWDIDLTNPSMPKFRTLSVDMP